MVLSLLCNHWQVLFVFLQLLNKTKNQKTKQETKKNTWQDPTLCHYSPLGVCKLFFLVSCFFGFLFPGSLLVFSAMANNTKNPKKKQETRKTRNQTTEKKRQDPTLCHYSPPWGVQSFFFWFLVFFGFLFPGSLLVFSAMANNTKNPKKNKKPEKQETKQPKKKRQDPTLCHYSPLGVCNLVFFLVCLFIFFGFLVFGFLVFWFMFFYLKG